jgi:transposase-like protein
VYTEAERERFLNEAAGAGESLSRFARRQGLNVSTAYMWSRTRSAKRSVTFARVVRNSEAPNTSGTGAVTLRVGSAQIDVHLGFDAGLLRAIVEALSGGGP